ncbi:MAG: NAD-dependent epimerase/dehydratase family protein [Anaerolineales bacterium]|nr:NAD-dependent epimerase/dehydratase family protein [Anaerolineales bacterium]
MTQVAVLGATGVYGRALIPLLLQSGHTVRALARSTAKAKSLFPQGVQILECDLLAPNVGSFLPSLLDGCDAVAHIATAIPRDFSAPNAWEANTRLRTDGVRAALDASLKAGVKRYVQQSITMAYPDHGDEWITEDMPLESSSTEVRTPVITMEQMVRDTPLEKMQWCILRGGSFVGKDTFQEGLIERLRTGKEIVACDGGNFIALIHVLDMATATAAALESAPAGSIFNIVDEPLRQGDYLDRLADSIGAPSPKRDESVACPPSWRCSNQAAKLVLKWQPQHGVIPSTGKPYFA